MINQRSYIKRLPFRILFPWIAGIILYILMLMVFGNLESLSESFFSQEVLFLVFLSYLNHEWAIFLLGRKRTDEAVSSNKAVPGILYFLLMLTGTFVLSSASILAYFFLILKYYHFITELITINILLGLFQLLVHIYYMGILNIRRYHRLSLEKEEMDSRQIELELESFKSEMNPGLLMECLENLISLVNSNQKEADAYINALSNQYRYMLDNRKKELISLEGELAAAEGLVYLLNGGGDQRLVFRNEIEATGLQMIPGTLQSLIHSLESSMIINTLEPLIIKLSLSSTGDMVLSHPDRPKLVPVNGISLEKLNTSYRHFTEREISNSVQEKQRNWIIPKLPDIIE